MSLEQTISLLQSNDNAIRSQAENIVNQSAESAPEQFMIETIRLVCESQDPQVRQLSCILYRRNAFNPGDDTKSAWPKSTIQTRMQVQARLLQALQAEPTEIVRKSLCDSIAETARYLIKKQEPWVELPPFLFQLCQSPSPDSRTAALEIFAALPGLFDEEARARYLTVLKEIFVKSMQDQTNVKVSVAGFKAAAAFIIKIKTEQRQFFGDTVPDMIQVLRFALQSDEHAAKTVLGTFIDLIDVLPAFFRRYLALLVPTMSDIINQRKQHDYDNSIAHLALEVLLLLAEKKAEMCKKYENFVTSVLPACLSLMVDVEEDPKWHTTDEIEDDEMDANETVGEQGLDRLSVALRGHILTPVFQLTVQMLQHEQWQYRHAGLLALGAVAEGCKRELQLQLQSVVPEIVKFAQDSHPRVRHAFCNCIGQFCLDFSPLLQEKYASLIIPAMMFLLNDVANPRVQSHAAAALVNFADDINPKYIQPYLDTILEKLLSVLSGARKRFVLEQTIDTIATIADAAGTLFRKHYPYFVPLLKSILAQPVQKENRLLRGKTMECITLIGLAVGRDMFLQDGREIMQLLLQVHGPNAPPPDADDPQTSYLLSAFGRIGSALKEDFVPYLPQVMPSLMRSASLKPQIAVIDPDESDGEYDPNDGWEIVELDDQRVGIKTSSLEEKLTAVEMLFCFARELGGLFAGQAAQVLELDIPLLKFYFDESTRLVAASSIAPLLDCLKQGNADPNYIFTKWHEACQMLLSVIQPETEVEILIKLWQALREAVQVMGDNCMTDEEMKLFCEAIVTQLQASIKRSTERLQSKVNHLDEDEADELENLELSEDYLLQDMADAMHAVIKTQTLRFLPIFQQYAQLFSSLVPASPVRTASQRQWALCAFDDVLEYFGPHSYSFCPLFWNDMVAAIHDDSPKLRQAACYGVGVAAQFGGPAFALALAETLPRLLAVINSKDAKSDDENQSATENAISAMGKICQHNSSAFDVNQVLPVWLDSLPITADAMEAVHVYSFLCSLIESNNTIILGQDNSNLPKLVSVLATAIGSKILEDEEGKFTMIRVLRILRQIHTQVPAEMRPLLWSNVDQETQQFVLPQLEAL